MATMNVEELKTINENYEEKYGFNVEDTPLIKLTGLNETTVSKISELKSEPLWMKEQRFKYQKNKVEEYRRSLVQDDNQKIEVKHPPSQIIKDKILETIRKYFDSSSIRY